MPKYNEKTFETLIQAGKVQIASSAICVALFVTASSKAKASSKIASFRQLKQLIGTLNIHVDLVLQARMASKLAELTARDACMQDLIKSLREQLQAFRSMGVDGLSARESALVTSQCLHMADCRHFQRDVHSAIVAIH